MDIKTILLEYTLQIAFILFFFTSVLFLINFLGDDSIMEKNVKSEIQNSIGFSDATFEIKDENEIFEEIELSGVSIDKDEESYIIVKNG